MSILRIGISLFVLLSLASVSSGDPLQDAKNAADNIGNSFLNSYGSQGGIQQNIANPMTGSAVPMTTLDGSKQFNAQLKCPSSKEFLTVFIQPSATEDLSTVLISQDTDMDGSVDYTYQVPVLVSGICANGIISCDAGTWDSCKHYGWTADDSGRANLIQVSLTDLGGCYCINNNCGNNLVWNNLGLILRDIGGGVVGAVQSVSPQSSVSDVKIDGTLILYYGQQSGSCINPGGGSGVSDPQKYYSNPALLTADSENTKLAQSSDPLSYYNMLINSAPNINGELRTCRIARVITFDEAAKIRLNRNYTFIGGWDRDGGSKQCFYATGWMDNCTELAYSVGSWDACWDSYLSRHSRIAAYINSVFLHNDPNRYVDTVDSVTSGGMSNLSGCFGSDNDDTDVSIHVNADIIKIPPCEELPYTEYIDDRCQALESDSGCRLREEVVDGILTYRDFNPTGLTPLPSTKSFGLTNCTREMTADWWLKKRTYFCTAETGFDFTDAQKRMAHVASTSKDNASTLHYQDMRKDSSGNWIFEDTVTTLPEREIYADCEKACKTRKPKADTQAGTSGHTGQQRKNTQGYDFFYKTCMNKSCPLGPGEELIRNCQCIEEFGEAAMVMQTLRLAGRDIICSSNVARPLQ